MAAAAVCTDLEHVQQFLMAQAAVLGPSVVQVTHSQHTSFMNRLGRLVSLSAESASQLTATVQSGPWTEDQKIQLCSAIAGKLTTDSNGRGQGTNVRRSNQEVRTFYNYLSLDDKSIIEDPAATTSTKIGVVCQRSLTIGLDIPSESSMKHIIAVVCGLGVKNFESDHEGLYGLVSEYKRWLKSFRTKGLTPPNCEFISHYPASPKDLPPAIYNHAYKSVEPWTCSDSVIAEINAIECRVPLRRSSKLVKPSPAVMQTPSMALPPPWMQAMCQMYLGGYPNQNHQQHQQKLNIQYLAPSSSSSSAALALPLPPAIPAQPVAAATSLPIPSDPPQQPGSQTATPTLALQDTPTAGVGVKEQMDAFMAAHTERREARDEKKNEEVPSDKKKSGKGLKNNKSPPSKDKTPLKKAKPISHTPPKKCKPASKAGNKQSSSTASKQVSHKTWHSTVQKAVGEKAWLKAASGCAKCRNKPFCTPSCWRGRGVNV
jgi:hypothetical protein